MNNNCSKTKKSNNHPPIRRITPSDLKIGHKRQEKETISNNRQTNQYDSDVSDKKNKPNLRHLLNGKRCLRSLTPNRHVTSPDVQPTTIRIISDSVEVFKHISFVNHIKLVRTGRTVLGNLETVVAVTLRATFQDST